MTKIYQKNMEVRQFIPAVREPVCYPRKEKAKATADELEGGMVVHVQPKADRGYYPGVKLDDGVYLLSVDGYLLPFEQVFPSLKLTFKENSNA